MIGHLFVYLLITVGCSCLWSLSDIFMPLRNYVAKNFPNPFRKMLLCMECSSFWIGFFLGFVINPLPEYFIHAPYTIQGILSAICGGIITYLTVKICTSKQLF